MKQEKRSNELTVKCAFDPTRLNTNDEDRRFCDQYHDCQHHCMSRCVDMVGDTRQPHQKYTSGRATRALCIKFETSASSSWAAYLTHGRDDLK